MKILQFNLTAFGPFTEELLDLGSGREGLHVIYGPNEAGKSSALRALRQMLYGISERSADNFLHPYARMRIGAVLKRGDGATMEFVRRKGRVNTLRGRNDETIIPEAELQAFLGGVDGDVFATMFGIDHADLIRGGQEIIRGGGNIGQVLFAAGSGISDLRKVQDELQTEVDNLFKPAAQKPRINEVLGMLRNNQKSIRDAQLPDQEWARHDELLRDALESKLRLQEKLEEKGREHHRLGRVQEALPAIGRRKELLNQLEGFSTYLVLPPDFGERRRNLVTRLKIAEKEVDQTCRSLEETKKAFEALIVPDGLLENAEIIRQLHQDLGSYVKANRDRGRLVMQQQSLEEEAGAILQELRADLTLDQAEQLRVGTAESVRIQELGSAYERLALRLETSKGETLQLRAKISQLDKQLAGFQAPPDTGNLIKTIEHAQAEGYLEKNYRAEKREIEQVEEELRLSLKKQSLWQGSLDEIEELALPLLETVDVHENRLAQGETSRERYRLQLEETEGRLFELEGDIEELRLEGEVPSEEELLEARQKRERGWTLVREAWMNGAEGAQDVQDFVAAFPPAKDLASAYECSVKEADDIADRLRREADGVAEKAALVAAVQTQRKKKGHQEKELAEAEQSLKENQKQWHAEWSGVGVLPQSPREMRAWIQNMNALAKRVSSVRERGSKLEDVKNRIQTHRDRLSKQIEALGESPAGEDETLMQLIDRGQRVVDRLNGIKAERLQVSRELEQVRVGLQDAESRKDRTEEELLKWRSEWAEATRPLGLDGEASPGQANAVMHDIKAMLDKLKEAKAYSQRVAGIDRDAGEFSGKVNDMAKAFASDLLQAPVRETVTELHTRLTQGEKASTRREDLEEQHRKEQEKSKAARNQVEEIRLRLEGMCEEAGCKTVEELAAAEEKSDKRRTIEEELEQIDKELHKLGAGSTLEEFVKEAQFVDPDTIEPTLRRLGEEIKELEKEKSELDQKIGEERNELARMDGSAQAADLAEESQLLLGRLESDVDQYVRLKLATAVLSEAIERYREKHQGPILKRSADLFARMTLGSFEGLRADFDEKGDAVLVGVRPGGKEVLTVEEMSDGTADQLYLAVRLASLEAYMERNEPMPFIVDDILLRFDDERAVAALLSLGELSAKTQVVFFTHHRRLVELAEANVEQGMLYTHVLPK